MKIAILGYSGSGKSTFGKYLSNQFHIPLLYLDTVQFEANWKERDRDEACSIVQDFMNQDQWIIEGNYLSFLQAKRLEQADYVICLLFSRWNCLLRAWKRYIRFRNQERESMASGCIEKMDLEFMWWILYKGRTRKKQQHFQDIINQYPEKTIILKNQRQLDTCMQNLAQGIGFHITTRQKEETTL